MDLSIFIPEKYFSGANLSLSGCSHVGLLFMKSSKKFAHDAIDASATHVNFIPDVMDSLPDTKWQHSRYASGTFKHKVFLFIYFTTVLSY